MALKRGFRNLIKRLFKNGQVAGIGKLYGNETNFNQDTYKL
jgi:hypothetical protein